MRLKWAFMKLEAAFRASTTCLRGSSPGQKTSIPICWLTYKASWSRTARSEASLRTTLLYTHVTARAVHEALVKKGWSTPRLPGVRAISNLLTRQDYRLRTVATAKVQKKRPRPTPSLTTSGG